MLHRVPCVDLVALVTSSVEMLPSKHIELTDSADYQTSLSVEVYSNTKLGTSQSITEVFDTQENQECAIMMRTTIQVGTIAHLTRSEKMKYD